MSAKRYSRDVDGNEKYDRVNGKDIIYENRYAETIDGEKFYPQNDDRDEFMDDKLGLIANKAGILRYPLKDNGDPNYRTELVGNKIRQLYQNTPSGEWIFGKDRKGREHYAKDEFGNDYLMDRYAEDENKQPFYPRDKNRNEFMTKKNLLIKKNGKYVYPLKKDGDCNYRKVLGIQKKEKDVYEFLDNRWIMCVNEKGDQQYAKDEFDNDYLRGFYAQLGNGQEFYPRNSNSDEFMDATLGLIKEKGVYVYPLKENSFPNYRVDELTEWEIYEKKNGKWIIGRDFHKNGHYARDKFKNEYYPPDNTPATKADGSIFYATTFDRKIIFPKRENGDEYYLTEINVHKKHTIPSRYALEGKNEIYPVRLTLKGMRYEYLLGNTYARQNGVKYYPLDAYNNEYYLDVASLSSVADCLLPAYAVTNDGKVILPDSNGEHYIDKSKNPPVTPDQILGILIREEEVMGTDHLTSVKGSTKPRGERMAYMYYIRGTDVKKTVEPFLDDAELSDTMEFSLFQFLKMWQFWVTFVVLSIVKYFLLWCFFHENGKNIKVAVNKYNS